jgi:NAD(P)H-nitrite reductase large subunit
MAARKERDKYIIVGGGLAGAAAVEGIREHDKNGPIVLIASEDHLPYNRPPLSKKLWSGKEKVEDIFVNPQKFYDDNGVRLVQNCRVETVDASAKTVTDAKGTVLRYEKLLLATGGAPQVLTIPGAQLAAVCYFRTLDDYVRTRREASDGRSAVVIGGGFIGTEIAAALQASGVAVTMIFPSPYLCKRVFPEALGWAVQKEYRRRGITVLAGDKPVAFSRQGDKFLTQTAHAKPLESDMVIVGVGIEPETALAAGAGLTVGNGIVVNEFLQTSHPDTYAAGDNAFFPYAALGRSVRMEHWDNAQNQGRWAGQNMAGAALPYTYMPYFFSDLFDFGYEAVGDVTAELETVADWQVENEKGVVYYVKNGLVRGALMCNVWDKVPLAREAILKGKSVAQAKHDLLAAKE